MYIFFIVLIILASALLILAVLVQSPKSGMAANFGASNQVMGVRQTSDFLEKFTWATAIIIVVLSIMTTMFMPSENIQKSRTEVEKMLEESTKTDGIQDFTIPQPQAPAEGTAPEAAAPQQQGTAPVAQ